MKVTRLGEFSPFNSSLSGGGGFINNPIPGSGLVPVSSGSNTWAWASNIQMITSNSSNLLLGPFINIASGSNITFAASSNTLTINSSGAPLTVKDEGLALATAATSLDFVGTGVVASGSTAAKTITISGVDAVFVPYFIAASETFTVPLYKQALFSMLIDNEGILDVVGFLSMVD